MSPKLSCAVQTEGREREWVSGLAEAIGDQSHRDTK